MRRSAQLYDLVYETFKGYAAEALTLHRLIQQHSRPSAATLLDVACGTGQHLAHLRDLYQVRGLDADPAMLAIAAERLPSVPLHHGDMRTFDLAIEFDVVTCLFSAIGYMRTVRDLRRALSTMARHVRAGGLLIVEPWFTPDAWQDNRPAAVFVDRPEIKIARMNVSSTRGRLSILDFHYLVATSDGVERFHDRFQLGLFTQAEYLSAFAAAGLSVQFNPDGLMGRGLYVATKA
jgi:SAM-dependent methyltransferase